MYIFLSNVVFLLSMEKARPWPIEIPVITSDFPVPDWWQKMRETEISLQAVSGFMPLDIFRQCAVPAGEAEKWKSYRSVSSQIRVEWMRHMLESGPLSLVPPVLLSCRQPSVREWFMVIKLDSRLLVVSGHDQAAAAITGNFGERVEAQMKIPFTCLLSPPEEAENRLFLMSMRQPGRIGADVGRAPPERQMDSNAMKMVEQIRAQGSSPESNKVHHVVEKLSRSHPWRGVIKMAGERPTGKQAISGFAFGRTLNSVAKAWEHCQNLLPEGGLANMLETFWCHILQVEGFEEARARPKDYLLQKALGVNVLHTALAGLLGQGGASAEECARKLEKPLLSLTGEKADGGEVAGLDFWRAGKDGCATVYNSTTGRSFLASKLLRMAKAPSSPA